MTNLAQSTARYSIGYRAIDEFGCIPGYGWVILYNGKRMDWPMLSTKAEAEADLRDFIRTTRQLTSDEMSESRFYNR